MSIAVREGRFDVAIVAGPRADPWPSAGVRALSALCAEMGLSVGVLGGDTLRVRGVIPLPGTGALVLTEDLQRRIHRIHARSVVKVTPPHLFPEPFPGWRSPGLIPLSTALRLRRESHVAWSPSTVILGTGNPALKFGSQLLEAGTEEVFCVETLGEWASKHYSGWEVERKRFEMLGGRVLEANPVSLAPKAPLLWEFKLKDAQGVRVLEVAWVVGAGPFHDVPGIREHPPESFLFELEQSAPHSRNDNIEGWVLEEERGRWLASRIIKALVADLGSERRDELDRVLRRTKVRLKNQVDHQQKPFEIAYQGKWVAPSDMERIHAFSGTPRTAHRLRATASIECFENIPCNICEKSCPESAINMARDGSSILVETDCTACGLCLNACPSATPVLIHEREEQSNSRLTLAWRGSHQWAQGEFATVVNRRGESLGTGRIIEAPKAVGSEALLVEIEVPTHLIWEARGLRRLRTGTSAVDEKYLSEINKPHVEKVEVTIQGERRLVRDGIPISVALFELGYARAEDVLLCPDGSCGLCSLTVDGVSKLACRAEIHRGMSIRMRMDKTGREQELCPCQGISREQVLARVKQGKLSSPEAVLLSTHVGEGKCHGQLCVGSLKTLLTSEGVDASNWIDWRFPWMDWVLTSGGD